LIYFAVPNFVEMHSTFLEFCAERHARRFVESSGRSVAAYGCESARKEYILSALLKGLPSFFILYFHTNCVMVPSIGEEFSSDLFC